jgi:hypothetical protein
MAFRIRSLVKPSFLIKSLAIPSMLYLTSNSKCDSSDSIKLKLDKIDNYYNELVRNNEIERLKILAKSIEEENKFVKEKTDIINKEIIPHITKILNSESDSKLSKIHIDRVKNTCTINLDNIILDLKVAQINDKMLEIFRTDNKKNREKLIDSKYDNGKYINGDNNYITYDYYNIHYIFRHKFEDGSLADITYYYYEPLTSKYKDNYKLNFIKNKYYNSYNFQITIKFL